MDATEYTIAWVVSSQKNTVYDLPHLNPNRISHEHKPVIGVPEK